MEDLSSDIGTGIDGVLGMRMKSLSFGYEVGVVGVWEWDGGCQILGMGWGDRGSSDFRYRKGVVRFWIQGGGSSSD